jgi:hypothetical protein
VANNYNNYNNNSNDIPQHAGGFNGDGKQR